MQTYLILLGYFLYFPLIWWAGNMVCRFVFKLATVEVSDQEDNTQTIRAGRYIGLFERVLITLGIIVHQWEIIVAVIALKTVARYRDLDNQINAEYFLVGSLVSLLWAVIVTVILIVFDQTVGFELIQFLSQTIIGGN